MKTEQILGVHFFSGTPEEAVREMSQRGGLLVAPSGTCFERLSRDERYREAIAIADLALPDSGLMVLLWKIFRERSLHRISGLAYVKKLIEAFSSQDCQPIIWVLPNECSMEKLLSWASGAGLSVSREDCYVAPIYVGDVRDETLLALVDQRKPRHVVVGIGAGAQEKLGLSLRERLSFRPAIHCVGGALGFVTGDQVAIPNWADRLYLGWLFRLLSQPRVFLPRLWRARILPWWIWKYGAAMPP